MLLAQAAPYILSMLGGRKREPNPQSDWLKAIGLLNNHFSPYVGALDRSNAVAAQGMNQNLAAAFARAGITGTGTGTIAKELGNAYQTNAQAQGRMDLGQMIAQLAAGMGPQFTQAKLQGPQTNRFQDFQGLLGMQMLNGQNPFTQLAGMLPGAQPRIQTGYQPLGGSRGGL